MARLVTDEERERARRGGEWLREERKRRGYDSGTEFAAALGIRQGRLSSYENGNYLVEYNIANRIAEVFGMSQKLTWYRLGLPLPAEDRRDAEAIAAAWDSAPKAMAEILGRKPPPPRTQPARKATRVTREGDKSRRASPGEQSAV